VPKPSHLRAVDPTPAPAAQGGASRSSGAPVPIADSLRSAEPSSAPAAQGGASRSSGAPVPVAESLRSAEPSPAPAAQGGASRSSGAPVPIADSFRSAEPSPAPAAQGGASRSGGISVEVVPKPRRRRSFPAAEKLRIVRAAAACTQRGDVEALLRREGIYSSLLTAWRKELALHGSEALAGRKPGRKPKLDAKDRRIAELEKHSARLEAKLSLAEKLIDLQKKVSAILGITFAADGES
jgi:transposase